MTQEDKELLLKDLCARLPYGVKAYVRNWSKIDRKYYEDVYTIMSTFPSLNEIHVQSEHGSVDVLLGYSDYDIKPYLFPMSSLTEEQRNEICKTIRDMAEQYSPYGRINPKGCDNLLISCAHQADVLIEYFYKNHIDFRGLIENSLALDATGLDIY